MRTPGHYSLEGRLADLDRDGIACGVIFHGSTNGEPIPFIDDFGPGSVRTDMDVAYAGIHIYNEWLADFVASAPERSVGCAHLPMWDVELAVEEATWARQHGLISVNLPGEAGGVSAMVSPLKGRASYNDRAWDALWATASDLDLTLTSHAGSPEILVGLAPEGLAAIHICEAALVHLRPIIRLVNGGVFERFPRLRLVVTELMGDWWPQLMTLMDSAYHTVGQNHEDLRRAPSEYCQSNVWIGASMQSRGEATAALEGGYWSRCMWGSDYPHPEGTWYYTEHPEEYPLTRLAIRNTYAGLPVDQVEAMVGLTGVEAYHLDADQLRDVARRINAPTIEELTTPVDEIPENHGMWAFRKEGAYA